MTELNVTTHHAPPTVTVAEVRHLSMWVHTRAYLVVLPVGNRVFRAEQIETADAWRCVASANELDRLIDASDDGLSLRKRWEPLPWSPALKRLSWDAAAVATLAINARLAETWK